MSESKYDGSDIRTAFLEGFRAGQRNGIEAVLGAIEAMGGMGPYMAADLRKDIDDIIKEKK